MESSQIPMGLHSYDSQFKAHITTSTCGISCIYFKKHSITQMNINIDLLISNAPSVTMVRAPWGIRYLILSIWEGQILSCVV